MRKQTPFITWATIVGVAVAAVPALGQQGNSNPNQLGRVERANKVYSKQVISSDNQKVGNLNNLIVDLESGRILFVTIGESKARVGVVPQIFLNTPTAKDTEARVNVTKAKIDGAPQFTGSEDNPAALGNADYISKLYQYFGQPAWWQGNQAANVGSFHNVHKASELIGMTVEDVNNAKFAKANNAIVDLPPGRIVYMILEPDSSLNLGNNLYPVPPDALTLSQDHKNLVTGIDKAKLAGGPHFDKSQWPNLADPNYAAQVYQYYGKQAWFNSGAVAPTGR